MGKKIPEIKANKGTIHVHTPFLAGDLMGYRAEFLAFKNSNRTPTGERLRWALPFMVSVIETFYKELFAKYIDIGEPYLSGVESLHNQNKPNISFETLRGLSKKEFSIGDLYAYSFKYNSIDGIRKNYEVVCGCDYIERVETAELSPKAQDIEEIKRARANIRSIFPKISEVYRMRHAIVHEYPAIDTAISLDELLDYLDCGWLLLMITDRIFWAETKLPNPFFRE